MLGSSDAPTDATGLAPTVNVRHPAVPVFGRWWMQLPLGLILVATVGLLVGRNWESPDFADGFRANSPNNTLVAAMIATLLGYYLLRKVWWFPASQAFVYVLSSFGVAFGSIVLLMFALRVDYARLQFAATFVVALAWFSVVSALAARRRVLRIGLVPSGRAHTSLATIEGVDWRLLSAPQDRVIGLNAIAADFDADLDDAWERFLTDCALAGLPVLNVREAIESLTGRVEILHLSENTLGSLNPNDAYLGVKRAIDTVGAAALLVVALPLMLIVALAIRLESAGPALFRQVRVGFRGRPFTIYKFRTMQHEPSVEAADATKQAKTLQADPRITRLGRFLRRSRIDELPQLINILRGEMSFIGPRPEALALASWYEREIPFYRYRHLVRPGISGWAQVNQGHVVEIEDIVEKLYYDFYYVKQISAWIDVLIVLKTVATMLTGRGAR